LRIIAGNHAGSGVARWEGKYDTHVAFDAGPMIESSPESP
jgi:hypothetical protein